MTDTDAPRTVPFPPLLSPEATAVLEMTARMPAQPVPAPDDLDAWRAVVAPLYTPEVAPAIGLATTGALFDPTETEDEIVELSESVVYTASPADKLRDDVVLFFLHGGGFTMGGGEACKLSSRWIANTYKLATWSVDYRLPPEHRFPAGLDDVVEAYETLISRVDPSRVVVGGLSGGAHMALTLLHRLSATGRPLPAAMILNSPPVDSLARGDSLNVMAFAGGYAPGSLARLFELYAAGHDLTDPLISPIEADIDNTWPPTILITGTRDFLLSDTARMHRRMLDSGVDAELHVFEGAPHGFFGGRTPEDQLPAIQIRRFIARVFAE